MWFNRLLILFSFFFILSVGLMVLINFGLSFFSIINLIDLQMQLRFYVGRFMTLLLIVSIMIFIWSGFYIYRKWNLMFFYLRFLRFVFSIGLLLMRDRILFVFLGWEGLGISSFMLIIFFQNWVRINGGLLTLLTNRVGDGILLIVFGYWLIRSFRERLIKTSSILSIILVLLCFTKRAQWPFVRWLPAAIAAPTPVRALVHSSTLVTAGVWLIMRFSFVFFSSLRIWTILGRLTLSLASLAALSELDAKKLVALSTLRQLGLIFIRIRVGNYLICFFHTIMHAISKANLFIVIGNVLHFIFSQQDARKLHKIRYLRLMGSKVRVLRLGGICFISGFYSKEQILNNYVNLFNRFLVLVIFLIIISLTLAYIIKLLLSLDKASNNFTTTRHRVLENLPILIIRFTSILIGFISQHNFICFSFIKSKNIVYLLLFFSVLIITTYKIRKGFNLQLGIINNALKLFKITTKIRNIKSSLIEIILLSGRNLSISSYNFFGLTIIRILIIIIIIL